MKFGRLCERCHYQDNPVDEPDPVEFRMEYYGALRTETPGGPVVECDRCHKRTPAPAPGVTEACEQCRVELAAHARQEKVAARLDRERKKPTPFAQSFQEFVRGSDAK
jgi:hypothetical protein